MKYLWDPSINQIQKLQNHWKINQDNKRTIFGT